MAAGLKVEKNSQNAYQLLNLSNLYTKYTLYTKKSPVETSNNILSIVTVKKWHASQNTKMWSNGMWQFPVLSLDITATISIIIIIIINTFITIWCT